MVSPILIAGVSYTLCEILGMALAAGVVAGAVTMMLIKIIQKLKPYFKKRGIVSFDVFIDYHRDPIYLKVMIDPVFN